MMLRPRALTYLIVEHHELGLGQDYKGIRLVAEPLLVQNLEDANLVQVAGGNGHTLILNRNGEVFAFGKGQEGQLGLGSQVRVQLDPCQVKDNGLGDCIVKKICAGDGCSAAVTTHGELFEWGFIHAPTDGDANNPSNALPGLAREVRGMSEHLKELLRASTIQYLQGDGAHNGEHGMDQEQVDAEAGILVVRTRRKMKYLPVKSPFRHRVRDIALGYGHTLIVTELDGTAWAKGYNGVLKL
jgi:alpha-tubulin suppressor-like RCC1 family protein